MHAPRETPHDPLPVYIEPFAVDDGPPTEEEVAEAVRKLKNRKAAGATGINAEHLKTWLREARPDGDAEPVPSAVVLWEKVLELVRLVFVEGEIPRAFNESILVLIPKAEQGQFRGIALLDVVYKVMSSIINRRMMDTIQLHDALHGSCRGRGTGTAVMEAKLLAQLRCRIDEPLYMVFIDLKKAFYSLDRERALRILELYGVGFNLRRIISTVWQGDTMVPRQSGYFGRPFQAERGVRVGDTMSPMVFNVVIDAVIRHWEHTCQPIPMEEASLFYIDDGALTGTDAGRLQVSLDTIARAFESFGLFMNASKTKFMVMSGGKHRLKMSSTAYNRHVTGEGMSHRERSLAKVQCIKCGAEVCRASLKRHQQSKKCKKAAMTYEPPTPVRNRVLTEATIVTPRSEPRQYLTTIRAGHRGVVECPVPGCPFHVPITQNSKRLTLRKHFRARHIEDGIRIQEEGQLPQCTRCGLFMKDANSDRHHNSVECRKFTERRARYFRAQRQADALEVNFSIGGAEIERVKQFRYLGRILDENDDGNHALQRQLARARTKWGRIAAVLRSQGMKPRAMGYFYKAIVQTILLYGSETWVLSDFQMKQLRSFHSRVARYITGRHIRQNADGTWFHPPTEGVLEEAGLRTIDEYIRRRRDTVRHFVRFRPIYEVCRQSTAISNRAVWWKLD